MKAKNLLLKVSEWLRRRVTALKSEKGAVKREELREEGMTPKSEEPMESRATLGANRSTSNAETLMMRMEEFIGEHYEVRLNKLSQQYELAEMGKGEWMKLDDELCSRLMMEMNREGIAITKAHLVRTVVQGSGLAQKYHPVCSYLENLPQWDGTGHIEALFRRVTDDEQLLGWLRRWFIGMVAQVMGRMGTYGNSLCPILISRQQGWGKSQFTKLLMPPELMVHYTDTFNLAQEEQCLRKMAQHLLVNLDEFDRHSATGHATLKGLLQLADIKVKRPHRAQFEEMPRMASFIGTSNRRMLLRDRTGSRRYICVELSAPIDVDTPVDHAQLYAQALHLLDEGMRYWLDEEETLRLEEHNAPYKMEHGPEELLTQHFTPVAKKKHYADDELWSAVAVYDYLHRIDPLLMRSVERTTFGMYVRRMGFEQVRRENKRYFAAKLQ